MIPVAVVVEFVVARIGQVHPEPRANRVEDLNCCVNPNLTLFKSLQVYITQVDKSIAKDIVHLSFDKGFRS